MSKKSNKTVGQELAVTAQSTVPDVLQAIDKKIQGLKHIQDSVYKTSGRISSANGTVDLKEVKSVDEVVKLFSSVHFRIKAVEESYEFLGITQFPVVKIDGGTREEWADDAKLRIDIINQKDTLDELNALKAEWTELMDKDDRKQMLMQKMQKFAEQ